MISLSLYFIFNFPYNISRQNKILVSSKIAELNQRNVIIPHFYKKKRGCISWYLCAPGENFFSFKSWDGHRKRDRNVRNIKK